MALLMLSGCADGKLHTAGGTPPFSSATSKSDDMPEDDDQGTPTSSITAADPSSSTGDASTDTSSSSSDGSAGTSDEDLCPLPLISPASCVDGPTGSCPEGVLWSPNTPVFSIAVSGCSIYYGTDGGLYRGVIGGTMVEPRGDQFVRGIAIDGQYVYFADQVGGEIRRVGASGGTSELLVGELSQPWQIAIDDDTVYYVTSSQVGAVPKEGGVAGILASRGPDDPSFNPYHLAVSEDHVYYATASELRRVPKAGGNSQVIAAGASVGALAIHRCTLFVVESQDDVTARLISLSIDGGQPKVLATGPYGPYGGSIAVDDDNVYWNDGVSDSGRVLQVPRDGGEPIELGNDLQYPLGVVSTTLDVIWAEGVSGGTTHFHRVPIGGC